MTAYTVLNCCDKLGIDLKENVSIGSEVSEITGTSAFLLPGDNLTIEQLLYGLLLPSGNDAAITLAQYVGSILLAQGLQSEIPNSASAD